MNLYYLFYVAVLECCSSFYMHVSTLFIVSQSPLSPQLVHSELRQIQLLRPHFCFQMHESRTIWMRE